MLPHPTVIQVTYQISGSDHQHGSHACGTSGCCFWKEKFKKIFQSISENVCYIFFSSEVHYPKYVFSVMTRARSALVHLPFMLVRTLMFLFTAWINTKIRFELFAIEGAPWELLWWILLNIYDPVATSIRQSTFRILPQPNLTFFDISYEQNVRRRLADRICESEMPNLF